MAKFWGLAAIVVGGIIVADLVIHPEGVKALGSAANNVWDTTSEALLGGQSVGGGGGGGGGKHKGRRR